MSDKPMFSRGGDQAIKDAKEQGGGATWERTQYFPTLEEGDSVTVRFLTEYDDGPHGTYNVLTHTSVKTKPKPSDMEKDAKWPQSMPVICRKDRAFEGMYDGCYICDEGLPSAYGGKPSKPGIRVYGLAVLREPVKGTQEMADGGKIPESKVGRIIAYKTAHREVMRPILDDEGNQIKDSDGKVKTETITQPAFVFINKAVRNFWQNLKVFYSEEGTIRDRDFTITAQNEGKDRTFTFQPRNPTESFQPGTERWEELEEALKDSGESFDVEAILMNQVGDEYLERFFKPETKKSKGSKSSSRSDELDDLDDIDEDNFTQEENDMLARMRAKVRG